MKHAKQYFDNHNTAEQLYFTSDGLSFFEEQNAVNHAKRLSDKTVTSMSREEADMAAADIMNGSWEDDLFDEFEEEYISNN